MEFIVKAAGINQVDDLQRQIRIENLHDWCAAIGAIEPFSGDKGEADFPWGRWRIHREVIRDGLRFTLPGRADAMQWTLTMDPRQRGQVFVYLSLALELVGDDHIKAIEDFMAAWKAGIASWPQRSATALANKTVGECEPSFGGFG